MQTPAQQRHDSVAAALDQVGDRWTFLVLRECFFGVRRFADFQRNTGAARTVLSDRLARLVDHGILERRRYSDRPPREEYRLTEKGRDLYGVTVALMRWGDRWVVDQPPLRLTHAADGGAVEQVLCCTHCGDHLTAGDITYTHAAD
ncbi:helix-turn-helix domain-containing protein [Streptomyces sp. NPDC001980]|uniref:winged helix-turn-helix transcriptional regulator n=1 Tax=Streptomyces sp. NPDC001980 TaxID=3157126 RepID=UPI00332B7D85